MSVPRNDIQTLILKHLLTDEDYTRKVIPHLKPTYFEGPHKVVFGAIAEFVSKYNRLPSIESLGIDISNSIDSVGPDLMGDAMNVMDQLSSLESVDQEWLTDQTEQWCQDRAIYLAIMESISIIDGKHHTLTKNALPDLLANALSVTFNNSIGHDYIEDSESRYDYYHRVEERIPFDLQYMNRITNNGLPRKSLTVVLAGTGVGKTTFMCHHAASVLMMGKNVLYLTLEMAEERIAERIDANLMNTPISNLPKMGRREYTQKIDNIRSKGRGRLIVKEYPTSSAHAGHFRALLNELKIKKAFVPDIIFVDYINLCASSRMKMGGAVNSYAYIKAVAEELRGLAVEHDAPLVTATQVNRQGFDSSDVDLTNTSESFGVPATADLMFALIKTEELEKMGQVMVKQLKNRYVDPTKYRRFVLGLDNDRMRFYDVEESAQTLIQLDGSEPDIPVFDSSTAFSKMSF